MKKHPAKISYVLLIFIFIIFFAPLIPIAYENVIDMKVIGTFLFLLILYVFILHMFFKTEYFINDGNLKIRCGFFSYKPIKINEMKKVEKTKSLLSSPAPSFDRIEISYGKFDSIIISPQDKYSFVKDLIAVNPNILDAVSTNK